MTEAARLLRAAGCGPLVEETREQLFAMRSADRVRTFEEHCATYDRLMLGE